MRKLRGGRLSKKRVVYSTPWSFEGMLSKWDTLVPYWASKVMSDIYRKLRRSRGDRGVNAQVKLMRPVSNVKVIFLTPKSLVGRTKDIVKGIP